MRNGYCAIGIILFVISKYTFLPDINGGTCTKLYNILDESQKKIYLNIFREKRRIYYISIVIGILLSFFYYNIILLWFLLKTQNLVLGQLHQQGKTLHRDHNKYI